MLRRRTLLLFLLALGLRLLLLGWDSGAASSSLHPDERQVGFVTQKIAGWFSDPDFYAYGSLHFQAVRGFTAALALGDGLRPLMTGGRILSIAASMLAIFLGWLLAHRAWGRRTADLFLLLAAWVPLDLQQSHFCTVEAHHTAWVMLAVAACFWLASGGRTIAAAAAGAAVGASLAVKVASLALVLPLAVAVLLTVRDHKLIGASRLAAASASAAVAAFWLCQPWAFLKGRPPLALFFVLVVATLLLDLAVQRTGRTRVVLICLAALALTLAFIQGSILVGTAAGSPAAQLIGASPLAASFNPAYLKGVGEQVSMVVGRADLPYVRVYLDTLPVLYSLRELAAWGWGPMLLLAALGAAIAGARRLGGRWRRHLAGRWSRSSILVVILLSWLVPMAARLSTLYVKYLRYWEPLVVPAALIAAWWLMRLDARYRRRAITAVAAGTMVWGGAYLWAFVDPHPHQTASRWLEARVAPGQVVAFESWDEAIELRVEGGSIERFNLPTYDLPDDEAKVERWCTELERADWVVLTSNRVMRTVFANPERFPRTARLYRLLLTGETGFEIVARVNRGPRILGLRWPVQRADESFVNYDFPQVVILRRTAQVPVEELTDRVSRPLPYLEDLGMAALDERFLKPMTPLSAIPSGARQVIDVLIWLLVFTGIAGATWVILLPVFRGWPDAGIGLSLPTGWVVASWLMWLGSEIRIWAPGAPTATWIFLGALVGGAVAFHRRRALVIRILTRRRSAMIKVATVVMIVGLLFLVVRLFNPAIFWGEKPMDFAFLNAFLNADQWPPGEPWMAGMPLHYYYFGEVLASFPILLTGSTAGVGYNLISATIPALGAAALASLALLLARRRRWFGAALLPFLVLLTGNLAWPWLLDLGRQGKLFDMWWATSRVIPGFAIDEYPLWTALFADLHGHFIALPVLLSTLAWGWLCTELNDRRWVIAAIFCGIGTAVLVATNPWDLFIFTATLGVGVIAAGRRPLVGAGRLAAAAGISILAAAPFIVELIAGINAGAGSRGIFLTDADFAPAWAVVRHFGLFLIPLGVFALATMGRRSWIFLPGAAIGIVAGLSFDSTAAALGLAAATAFVTVALGTHDRLLRLGWSLAALGCVAVAACERFTLIDRMNTLFKIYNGVWVLFAVALTIALLRGRGLPRRLLFATWIPLQLVAVVNLPLGIAQGWKQPRAASPRPSLDGQAFLAAQDPQDWFLIRSLQGAARPGDTVAEAAGASYGRFTRIAMHTGLPTVVGWEWHLTQRGQSTMEIAARSSDLETLYGGRDQIARRKVLDRYRVGWVVFSDVERERYGLVEDDPLRGIPGVRKITENGGAALYRVLPLGDRSHTSITPMMELPTGTDVIGELPRTAEDVVRSISLDESGSTAVLRDGSIVDLDLTVRVTQRLPPLGCAASSAARLGDERWAICGDGSLRRLDDGRWLNAGRVRGADRLTAAEHLWAWGEAGLWRRINGNWREFYSGPVAAAAAFGSAIAWSNGSTVWVSHDGTPQPVPGAFEDVSALAWQGPVLWALDRQGLYQSGGALLPWRRTFERVGELTTIAGGPSALWMVRRDGVVIGAAATDCGLPWQLPGEPVGSGLNEPRGIAVSPGGWFVVADTFNHRLVWYTDQGVCLNVFGAQGPALGTFNEPSGVALSGDGRLAIADTWNGRVQVLQPDGSIENIDDTLFGPRDLLWVGDGSLLVADTGNRQLLRFSPPAWERELVAVTPGPVVGLEWADGFVAAAVPADSAIVLVDVDEKSVVRRIEIPGWNDREQQEGYLAMLPSGDLVASAPTLGQLWRVDPSGESPAQLMAEDLPGVTGIALLPDGQLIGSLTWENRMVKIPVKP